MSGNCRGSFSYIVTAQWDVVKGKKLNKYLNNPYTIPMTERVNIEHATKTLLDSGVTVSNGTDCPVELPFALGGIQCAVTRCDLKGYGPYLKAEAFTVAEALDSFTKMGACASFEEEKKGQIRPGMLADFVVLGANPFETAPNKLKNIPILETYLNGDRVFCTDNVDFGNI